jgi:hypothetical protein
MSALKFTQHGDMVSAVATPHELVELYESRPATKVEANGQYLLSKSYRTDATFSVGTVADISAPFTDFALYDAARAELEASDLMQRLMDAQDRVRVRSRQRSEHDGEYDHDRRWDIQPFQHRVVQTRPGRILKMRVFADFSAQVKGDYINRYAALVSAIIGLVESAGVRVQLDLDFGSRDFEVSGRYTMSLKVRVKNTDQYFNAGDLLKTLSSNFYRRVFFMGIILAADSVGKAAEDGLGMARRHSGPSAVLNPVDGTLDIHSLPHPRDQESLLASILHYVLGHEAVPNE